MKTGFLFFLLFLLPFLPKAQETINGKVIQLHSSFGDVITCDEKNKFSLFPEFPDSIFQSAMFIQHPDYSFAFLIKPKKGMGKSFERSTSGDEIIEMCKRINKIEPGEGYHEKKEIKSYSGEYKTQDLDATSSVAGRILGAFLGAVIEGVITSAFDSIGSGKNDESNSSSSTTDSGKKDEVYAPRGDGKSKGNRRK